MLLKKIQQKEAKIGVVGLGYVGLPLVIEFCKSGFSVTGLDIDAKKIDTLSQGKSYIKHIPNEKIQSLDDYSFSDVFVEDNAVFLLYKHKQNKPSPLTLLDNWVEIEFFALNDKRAQMFYDWVEDKKKEVYVKTFSY